MGAAGLAYWQTDAAAVRTATEEALAIARELGDPSILAAATYDSAFWHPFEGDLTTAADILRGALFDVPGYSATSWASPIRCSRSRPRSPHG